MWGLSPGLPGCERTLSPLGHHVWCLAEGAFPNVKDMEGGWIDPSGKSQKPK